MGVWLSPAPKEVLGRWDDGRTPPVVTMARGGPSMTAALAVECRKMLAINRRDLGHTKGIATVGCYLKKSFISADI